MRYLIVVFLLLSTALQAQSISGTIVDSKDKSPLPGASISLLHLPDSVTLGTATDAEGRFAFLNVAASSYVLRVSFIGFTDTLRNIQLADGQGLELGTILLRSDAINLGTVEVVEQVSQSTQKGDTTQFNAGAFKTNPDANAEDLVTKMPGIQVQNGKVQAQGDDVKQVLVDGKPFFGDDPNAVLKNMPAEVIDKIQVFDQQSEQSRLTGFNDGNTSKTINIITKSKAKEGYFGKVFGGYGYGNDHVFRAGANINIFKGDRRITLLAQSNNVNEQNFSAEDLVGVLGSSGRRGGFGGGGGGWGGGNSDFLVNTRNGISTTHAFGFNYTDKWGKHKKVDLTASYFFNLSDNDANSETLRDYVLGGDSAQVYEEQSLNSSRNINHRFNVRMEYKIDSMNTLIVRPRFSLQQNNGFSNLTGQTTTGEALLNNIVNNFESDLLGMNFNNEATYQHRFKKKGRSLSFTLTNGYTQNNGESFLYSETNYFADSIYADTLDQNAQLDKNGWSIGSNITYTEGAGKNGLVQFNYGNTYNKVASEKETYDFSTATQEYTALDTTLTVIFDSRYQTQYGGISYRFNNDKLQFNLGANYQWSQLDGDQSFPYQAKISRSFQNVLPNAMLMYKFTDKKSIRLNYRTSTNQPNIEQLQDVIDNSNPLKLTRGNPGLAQEIQHRLFSRYSASNTEKSTSLFFMIAGGYTQNYIGKNTIIATEDTTLAEGIVLQTGSQLTTYENLDGYFNLRSFLTYGLPLKFMKSNFNLNAGVAYSHTPGKINNEINIANSTTFSLGLVVSSNISEKIDFTVSSNSSYTFVKNTLQPQSDNSYFNQNSRLRINWIFWKDLFINTDLSHQFYAGLSGGFDQNFLLWNAAVGTKLFKNKQGEIKVSAYDILKQNNSITRNITEIYTEDVRTDVLQRYVMLTFTYNIRKFKGGKNDKDMEIPTVPQGPSGMPAGGGPPPGSPPPGGGY
ncbi:MAG: TonB-dependent receptor [Chitinophagales bacterium]|nr:TonB-dependent receptor [Chitinophagales bacterium]